LQWAIWAFEMYNDEIVDEFYLNFSKAFDSVAQSELICTLRAYGFCDSLLSRIKNLM